MVLPVPVKYEVLIFKIYIIFKFIFILAKILLKATPSQHFIDSFIASLRAM